MRIKYIIFILTIILSIKSSGQNLHIEVSNPVDLERKNETISFKWEELKKHASWIDPERVIVIGANNDTLLTQIIEDEFLFQSHFKPNETKKFVLMNAIPFRSIETSVDVQFVTPREDVAWENERIAYRIYGSELAGDVRNGIDVWSKRVRYKIIDKWYKGNELKGDKKISYHVDHGEGADFFSVGKTLGAGGSALWKDGVLYQTGLFKKHEIIASGPIRIKFKVWYEADSINGLSFKEEKTYTLDAGQNLNRVEVSYSEISEEGSFSVALGLVKRKNTYHFYDKEQGWLSMWGLTNDDSTNGYLGTGIIFPPNALLEIREDNEHHLIIASIFPDQNFSYYTGAGWTRSSDFVDINDWNNYLINFTLRLQHPLKINFSTKE